MHGGLAARDIRQAAPFSREAAVFSDTPRIIQFVRYQRTIGIRIGRVGIVICLPAFAWWRR